jgi:hypothetical protein
VQLAAAVMGRFDDRAGHEFGERFVARCMARGRRRYVPRPFDPRSTVGLGLAATEAERRARGFGIVRAEPDAVTDWHDPNIVLIQGLAPAARQGYLEAMQRCRDSVDREVERRMDALRAALVPADRAWLRRLMADPDHLQHRATARWRACMAARGAPYPDQMAMLTRLETEGARLRTPRARARFLVRERAVALADLACARRFLDPLEHDLTLALARRLGDRYGVRSPFDDPWALHRPRPR